MTILALIGVNALLWSVRLPEGLTVTFLNIGQGDSILIVGPTGVQVLVDGGPDTSALREVGERIPFWDRTLDAIVATHPDADHIGGLSDILNRYDISYIFEPGIKNDTRAWTTFVTAINNEIDHGGARHIVARAGQRLILGGGAYADVLYPDHDVSNIPDTNSGSVVLHVVYGRTSFLLTGDLPSEQERELIMIYHNNLQSTVLKAGHHGSKNSSTPEFLAAVHPSFGIFSRGCNNRYGHPAPRVVDLFNSLNIPTFDTCEQGSITFVSDGQTLTHAP